LFSALCHKVCPVKVRQ